MKGNIISIKLIIIFIILLNLALVFNVHALEVSSIKNTDNALIVDINGKGEFISIQGAIDIASPGSKIYVKNGVYNEILNINKKIELIGEDMDYTIISPSSNENKYAINIFSENAKISKFSIENKGPGLYASAIRITKPKVTISSCNIHDTPIGVAIWTEDNIIENCKFYNCNDEGIAFLGSKDSSCRNNRVLNCIFEKNCDGIEMQYSKGNIIDNCDFYYNTHDGIDAIGTGNDNNIISNSRIYNNNVHGIFLSNSNENRIINCYLNGNNDGNIFISQNSEKNELIDIYSSINDLKDNTRTSSFIREIIKTVCKRDKNQTLIKILSSITNSDLLNY